MTTSRNKKILKELKEVTGIRVIIESGDLELESKLEDLPTDLLEKVAADVNAIILDRDIDWGKYLESGGL